MIEEGGADEEAFLVTLKLEAAAVDDQLGALVDAHLDISLDALLVRLAHHRAVMRIGIGRHSDAQGGDRRDELLAEPICGLLADRNHDRKSHAALAGGPEGGAGKVVHDLVEVGIGHDDAVVLGAAEGLNALVVRGAARIDVLRDVGRARRS